MKRNSLDYPIVEGEQIGMIRKRYRNMQEITPRYVGSAGHAGSSVRLDDAFAQALKAGYTAVEVDGDTYIYRGSEWYLFWHPNFRTHDAFGRLRK